MKLYVIAVKVGGSKFYLGNVPAKVNVPEIARKFSLPADAREYREQWIREHGPTLDGIAPEWDVAVEEFGCAETYGTAPPEVTP